MIKIEKVTECSGIEKLRNVSAITMEGLTEGSIPDFVRWAVENGGSDRVENITAHMVSGTLMNESYHLSGKNAYPDDLTIVSLTGVDTAPLAIPRLEVGARWMDDIIDNNLARNE